MSLNPPLSVSEHERLSAGQQPELTFSVDPQTGQPLPFPLYRPWVTAVLLLLGQGLLPLLVTINWNRVGKYGLAWRTFVLGYIGFPLLLVALGPIVYRISSDSIGQLAVLAVVQTICNVGLLVWHRPAYVEWESAHPVKPSAVRLGCLGYGIVAGLVVTIVAQVVSDSVPALSTSIAATFTSNAGRVSFTYPALWVVDNSAEACGDVAPMTCIATFVGPNSNVILIGWQSMQLASLSTDELAERVWDGTRRNYSVEYFTRSTDPVDGYEAVVYSGTLVGSYEHLWLVAIRSNVSEIIIVRALSSGGTYAAIDALIRSIEIKTPDEVRNAQ